jgi:hypothetical protein
MWKIPELNICGGFWDRYFAQWNIKVIIIYNIIIYHIHTLSFNDGKSQRLWISTTQEMYGVFVRRNSKIVYAIQRLSAIPPFGYVAKS